MLLMAPFNLEYLHWIPELSMIRCCLLQGGDDDTGEHHSWALVWSRPRLCCRVSRPQILLLLSCLQQGSRFHEVSSPSDCFSLHWSICALNTRLGWLFSDIEEQRGFLQGWTRGKNVERCSMLTFGVWLLNTLCFCRTPKGEESCTTKKRCS